MESAIFRLKSSLEGVNQNNPLIFTLETLGLVASAQLLHVVRL